MENHLKIHQIESGPVQPIFENVKTPLLLNSGQNRYEELKENLQKEMNREHKMRNGNIPD